MFLYQSVLIYILGCQKTVSCLITCYPYTSVIFMGLKQTVLTQIRHCIMWCLIRIFIVCLLNEKYKLITGKA